MQVEGNLIGTDVTGTQALSNGGYGVRIADGVTDVTIGGTAAGAGNVIATAIGSNSNAYGIYAQGSNQVIQGNFIGTDRTGTINFDEAVGI